MALMRRLLIDAQAKFRSMVEENKQIGMTRIEGEVHEDVSALRAELSDPGSRLAEPATTPSTPASATPASPTPTSPTPTSASSGTGTASTGSASTGSASTGSASTGSASTGSASTGSASDEAADRKNGDDTKSTDTKSTEDGPNKWSLSLSPLNQIVRPPSPKAGTSASEGASVDGRPPPSKSPSSVGGVGGGGDLPPSGSTAAVVSTRLRLENERLKREVAELRRLVSASGVSPGGSSASSASVAGVSPGDVSIQPEGAAPGFSVIADCDGPLRKVRTLEAELQQTKDALGALKADRKKLKAEKVDLLNQMKQLYGTLEDKEKELRDFIRNYEQRMRESEASLQQLSAERDERERERWSLLRHARDEAERSLELAAQLGQKEQQLAALQEQLAEARRSGCLSDQESLASASRINGICMSTDCDRAERTSLRDRNLGGSCSCSADSGVRGSSDRGNLSDSTTEGTPTITFEGGSLDMDSVSVESHHMYHTVGSPKDCAGGSPKDCSPSLSPLNVHSFSSRSIDSNLLSRSVEQLSSPHESEPRRAKRNPLGGRIVGGGTWGSISRVFARSRHRKAISPTSQDDCSESFRSWSPLTEEGYAEKLRLLREAAAIPMERWRAPTVLAWLEIALGMPQYGPRCAENIKSGKVLLQLSDEELEYGLGITHPMHRKKLRLAIEEHRHPALVRYPCIAQLTHTWVSSEWLPDLGLAQYSENFATNMVDARMLDHLSKKELEKFVGVTRKFHQASIVHGIHLLRMVKYDRQALAVRRHQSESVDADPLVWTNQRFMRWARAIDLHEYSDNLKDSGVHGALVVLEPSFNGDTMATALGIPPSKNIIRRHLAAELEALVLPARAAFEHYVRVTTAERRRAERLVGGGSLGRSFSRSYTAGLAAERAYAPLTYGIPAPTPTPTPSTADTSPPSDDTKDRRRASLRTYSLLYLKKLSSWGSSQGSLSRALGLGTTSRPRSRYRSDSAHGRVVRSIREDGLASPSSSSDNGSSSVASFQCRSESPCATASTPGGGPQQGPPSTTFGVHSTRRRHRRVKSIGDIDSITVTPV